MRLVIDLQGAQGVSSARGIGRYSRELAIAMAREAREHEVIVALSGAFMDSAEQLAAAFDGILPRSNIRLWHPPSGASASAESPLRNVAEMLRMQFLASLEPDLVHVTSLFEGADENVISLQPRHQRLLPVVATCYDLIPLVRHKQYFGDESTRHARWYYRCAQEMLLCDGLLAISQSSRHEAIRYLAFPPDRVFNVQAGIAPTFRPTKLSGQEKVDLLQRYGVRDSFILFLGAGDLRKNEAGLIAAYARLPASLRASHQLVIVGKVDPSTLRKNAEELHVSPQDFVIVPFVREGDLNALYSACTLFVFPSLHEGFGLPLAEAMACGAPAIASNTTSLPEVIGREDATFDPSDPNEMAACMRKVLENSAFREELAAYGPVQAARFTWQSSAARAWDALEKIRAGRAVESRIKPAPKKRSKLAFVSPLPPQPSGISDYSAELLPSLARYYDITLVSETNVKDPWLAGAFPHLEPGSFLHQADQFERVLYQIGNSSFHRFQIEELLPRVPGMVVLHDANLSDYMNWVQHTNGQPDQFRAILLHAHGYPALRFDAEHGRDAALRRYPCSLTVLQNSIGVIQHSRHGVELLEQHFGSEATRNIAVIPLVRADRDRPNRDAARTALGLSDDTFVVCSFGYVARPKCPALLIEAWQKAGISGKLVFVGGIAQDMREELGDWVNSVPGIEFTDWVKREELDTWLAAADVAIQWRINSRGETSAALADALMAGLPLIANRYGSAAELPDDVLLGLPHDADATDIASALVDLHKDPTKRTSLGAAGRGYALKELVPERIAPRYVDAIEQAYAKHDVPVVAQSMLADVRAVAGVPNSVSIASQAVARNFSSPWRGGGRPRLLVDMSRLVRGDHSSGGQRLVREIAYRALEAPPEGWRGEAVRIRDGRLRYTYTVPLAMLGHASLNLAEVPVDVRAGDILLCIDVNPELTAAEFDELRRLRLGGLRIVILVHSLLPLRHPDLFPTGAAERAAEWYRRMVRIADAALCTSCVAADEVIAWLDTEAGLREMPLPIGLVRPGGDFHAQDSARNVSLETLTALNSARKRPTVVMVGTLENGRGHSQVLAAFKSLWKAGEDLGLIIIGKQGWNTETFAGLLQNSSELGDRLHWLQCCEDAELRALYDLGAGLLMASKRASCGLAIAEALRAGLPVLARDLPIFREIAGDQARYFSGDDPHELAAELRRWAANGFTPRPTHLEPPPSWDNCYNELCEFIFSNQNYKVWHPKRPVTSPTLLSPMK
ncbi:glycosyltransferase [Bradyrhizobium sp. ARR65]|uniref:glycosyltransferase n=1 Tax=Bradyrhizobium sp. ARR65 TaxID=1040989 RepID=UPI00046492A6|nr:glycosyltransferase [Bradyrhizobium sp. ARR65]